MATPGHPDREPLGLTLVGGAGLVATAVGLIVLAPSPLIGFDAAGAVAGLSRQVPVTLPTAAIVLLVSILELLTGLILGRAARRTPFPSIGDALLSACVVVVIKDLVELSVLGQIGLFRAPLLAAIDLAILGLGWRLRPIVLTTWRPSPAAIGSLPIAALVGLLWLGPILVQLASPVVPFIDVLPNHVAPAEHLRMFGWFTPLTVTQSPIYGPSRSLLGFTAVLGTVTTLARIPAALAASAFILPTTLAVALAIHRLAVVAGGPGAGRWALLAFALTESYARLSDDRGTVVVLVVVCWAFGLVLERPPRTTWRLPPGVLLGLALGAAITVHPVVGALAVATVAVAGIVRMGMTADLAVTGGITAAIVAAPQAATMVGLALPALAIVVAIGLAIVVGTAVDRGSSFQAVFLRAVGGVALIGSALATVVIAPSFTALVAAPGPFVEQAAVLLIAAIVGFVIGVPAARSPLLLGGIAVGFAVAIATQAVPTQSLGLLGQALKFELPKTLSYWIPVPTAIVAGATLDWLWRTDRLASAARIGIAGLWLVVAALPLRFKPIDALHLGEHRFSEALAIDLRVAERGFWVGYPNRRYIVDQPRQDLIDAIRSRIADGRIGPDTPILHIAGSFQQWVATPLGVFTGVTETDVSPDAEDSIHTVGGRLLHLESLPAALASRAYAYLLFEPSSDLPDGIESEVVAAGYRPEFSNEQGTIYRLGPVLTSP